MDFVTGPPMIREENGRLVGFVFVDVAGRTIADYVRDAREVVESEVTLASGKPSSGLGSSATTNGPGIV